MKQWLLDVSRFDDFGPAFVPYEPDTGAIVFGMTVCGATSPGELVGVIHADGQEAVDKWTEENPNWHQRFSKAEGDDDQTPQS